MRLTKLAVTAAALLVTSVPAVAQDGTMARHSGLSMEMPTHSEDQALQAAVASPARTPADRARDAFRHPYESLTFWGLRPGTVIVEIEPGRGSWWQAILKPYAEATGGTYVPVGQPAESMGVADGQADFVLVARAFHNWSQDGRTEPYMAAMFRALKPGGVLAVEQHRAPEGRAVTDTIRTGYVPESHVIAAAEAAGFVFDGRSELNANPADDRDHPFGVWTLPPSRRSQSAAVTLTPAERAAYDAIGESDRMTLRFRKPQ